MSKKSELIKFLDYVQENHSVGIYYLDKTMNIPHYSIYKYNELDVLRGKIKNFNADLDDDLIKVLMWRSSDSLDYLTGVYDGIMEGFENI